MKTVLIALDYDPSAVKVAEYGFLFVQNMDAKVIFLHLISNSDVYSNIGHIIIKGFFAGHLKVKTEPVENPINIKQMAKDFLNKIKFHLGNDKIQIIIEESNSESAILETAKKLNVDLIVMGQHYKNWSDEKLIGSITHQVLLATTIPLLIIPIM